MLIALSVGATVLSSLRLWMLTAGFAGVVSASMFMRERSGPTKTSSAWKAFFEGMASAFDITGSSFRRKYRSPYGYSNDPWAEDREALQRDREALQRDWEKVMGIYGRVIEKEMKERYEEQARDTGSDRRTGGGGASQRGTVEEDQGA
jgi:hypothetical protein